jgi:alkanesulfonate monooxygenase SsuD/methylene tetrahydromethanopterin reductase-like flavin-dependent oxidoreductase (luciferase family)
MKAWTFQPVTYVPQKPLPQVWPLPGAEYDREIGERTFQRAIEQAVVAEQLGFDGVSFSEHHYAAASLSPSPAVIAGALSQHLKRATIALLGATLPLSNPVRVAEEYAVLDNLCGGRFVAGLLRGTPNEFLTYGNNPSETRAQYEEGIEIILKAWTEPQPFGWQGRHYQYRTISVWPRPLQRPYPPVFISANSKESGSFAASHHLNVGLSFCPPPVASQLSAFYREEAAKAGWEPAPENMLYRGFIHISETDQQAQEEVARNYWRVPTKEKPTSSPPTWVENARGERPQGAQDVKRALSAEGARGGLQFCGSPDTVFEQIRYLHTEAGIGIVDLIFQGVSMPHEMILKSMELFSKEVLPRMHEL